jgi:hypothetical protein
MHLAGGLTQGEFDAAMISIGAGEAFADIKSVIAFTGVTYYYSNQHLTEEQATSQARAEELRVKIIVEVRADSKYLLKLTNTASLDGLAPDVQPGEIDGLLDGMQAIPASADISVLTCKSGDRFAFSTHHMTNEYATVLLRAESRDPAYIIAETVREASEIYPRATAIELFKYPTFGIDRHELDAAVAETLGLYDDIKKAPNTGDDVYLYSDRFLTAEQAMITANHQRHGDS